MINLNNLNNKSTLKPLKVGILSENLDVSSDIFELSCQLKESDKFIPCLITGYKQEKIKKNFIWKTVYSLKAYGLKKTINKILYELAFKLINWYETKRVDKDYPNFNKKISLKSLNLKVINICGVWSQSGLYLSFQKKALRKIKNQKFDILVRCGSGILKGEILSCSKFGVISVHHGDDRTNRGGPSGFWEVFLGEPSSGFMIQILDEDLDSGKVLCRGNVATKDIWLSNQAFLQKKSNKFLMTVLEDIHFSDGLSFEQEPSLHHNNLYKISDNHKLLFQYIFKVYGKKLITKIKAFILEERLERWSIAYSPSTNLRKSLFRFSEIPNRPNKYFADPFVIDHEGRSVCFVEEYDYSTNKGCISAIELFPKISHFLGTVLDENFHLSFPFIFKEKNQIYMIPESSEVGEVRLYKCVNFPLKWRMEKVLLKNVSAVDTMIIKKDDLWFLLTNICSSNLRDHSSELHVFYSDKLMTNNWKELKCGNPVIFDSLRARNAGMFIHEGQLIRVNQVQKQSHYGASFCLNKVIELSKQKYTEIKLDTIEPNFKEGLTSTHHFHTSTKFSVVDYMKLTKAKDLN